MTHLLHPPAAVQAGAPAPRSKRCLLQAAAAAARRARQEAEQRLPELRQQAEQLLAEAKAAKAQPADTEHSVRAAACRLRVQSCYHPLWRLAYVLALVPGGQVYSTVVSTLAGRSGAETHPGACGKCQG